MQYLVSVIGDTAGLATPDEQAAIDVFNDRLMAEGHWVFAGGLAAPSSATVIDNRGEEAMFTDGPFLESKEYLAGFWIMEAADLDVALKLAAEGSKACPSDGFDESDRSQPAYQKFLKEIREAVSDRRGGVRSRCERPPARGVPPTTGR